MKQTSTYVLIAMWLWCVSAAGETIPITTQSLQANNYHAEITMPCNWDKDLDKIAVTGVYANPGEYTEVQNYSILDRDSVVIQPITPVSLSMAGNNVHFAFPPEIPMTHDGKYLYHLNVDIGTTKSKCKEGFGFGFGTR